MGTSRGEIRSFFLNVGLELKEVRERPLYFYVLIAILIHVAIGYGVIQYLQTPAGQEFTSGIKQSDVKTDPSGIPPDPGTDSNPATVPYDDTDQPEKPVEDSNVSIPPFEPSSIQSSNIEENTFIHESSGLLFADEIEIPGDESKPAKRKLIPPKCLLDFNLRNLPPDYRHREWVLKLRLRVNKTGSPVGRIRIVKSSGDEILDQIIVTRISQSRFEPAHYSGSTEFFDHTFDLDIHYK